MKYPKSVLEDLKSHLFEEKKLVEAQIADLSAQDPFANTDRLTDNAASDTEAKEEFDHDRFEAMLKELNAKRDDIVSALDRITKGEYGFCNKCKKMIDTDRLAAMPLAQFCMKCEEEKKSK